MANGVENPWSKLLAFAMGGPSGIDRSPSRVIPKAPKGGYVDPTQAVFQNLGAPAYLDPLRSTPFIGDPSGSGRNVAADYMAGGRYSSQRSLFDQRTIIPSPTQALRPSALIGAWANLPTSRPSASPTAGMPAYLQAARQRNLQREDSAINRFNFTARFGSAAPTTQPRSSLAGGGGQSWRFTGFDHLYGAHSASNALYRPQP
jgi:hypothetical protein